MSNIVFAYSFLDPESTEAIGDPVFEDVTHISLFPYEIEPKEKDMEEYNAWINVYLLFIYISILLQIQFLFLMSVSNRELFN